MSFYYFLITKQTFFDYICDKNKGSMEKNRLTIFQIIFRIIFLFAAIALISYIFPHSEGVSYEYEINKPWRYVRLTAPYDFPIYKSDSVIKKMEDSLQTQVTPRFVVNTAITEQMMSNLDRTRNALSNEAFQHLKSALQAQYDNGIISNDDKPFIEATSKKEARIRIGNVSKPIEISGIKGEMEVYSKLTNDSIFGKQYKRANIRDYITINITPDTAAMAHEYARLREEVSATTGIVLMDSRIVDQGEIVTQEIAEKIESYKKEYLKRLDTSSDETLMLIGRTLLVAFLLCSILFFLYFHRPLIFYKQEETLVIIGSITFMVVMTSIAYKSLAFGAYLVPIGIATIVIATFFGSRTAYFCHIIMSILCSFMVQSHLEYLFIQCFTGMVIMFNIPNGLNERSQLLRVSVMTAISYFGICCTIALAEEGTLANVSLIIITMMLCNSLLLLMSYLIIYVFEKTFHFMSGVTLLELCNLNSGLLDRLAREAPGSFEHSLHVSNMSANAAKAIGANAQLVRTGGLYHDIGKLWNPVYYTENQMGANPHDKLSTEESVSIIKKHVTEGLTLAKKAKLPNEIQEFIVTHHGHGLIKYFYTTWCNEHPDETPDVDFFSYDGEDPKTQEHAILMLADGVEAACKSLKVTTEETITALVTKIVNGIVSSGRLNQSKITLHEIGIVKQCFIKDLLGMYHSRIAYPELKGSEKGIKRGVKEE